MIKRAISHDKVQFYSTKTGQSGRMELGAWLILYTLKHNILTAGNQWVKKAHKPEGDIYYAEFFGKNYENAKNEVIEQLDCGYSAKKGYCALSDHTVTEDDCKKCNEASK